MAETLLQHFLGGAGTAKSVAFTLTANETLGLGNVVAVFTGGSYGVLRKAQSTTNQVIGIVSDSQSVGAGEECKIVQTGMADVLMSTSPSTSDIGKPVFLSTTAGVASFAAPSTSGHSVIRLGYMVGVADSTRAKIIVSINHVVHIG